MTLIVILPCPAFSFIKPDSESLEVTSPRGNSVVRLSQEPTHVLEIPQGDSYSLEVHNVMEALRGLRARGVTVEIVVLGAWQKLADALREERFQFTLVH